MRTPLIRLKRNNKLIRHLASIVIQNFYRRYIHWDRDPDGKPIDPISLEGIEKEHVIRVIYRTIKIKQNRTTSQIIGRDRSERTDRAERTDRSERTNLSFRTERTTSQIIGRVQIFDIRYLWRSILQINRQVPINPLTNTRFTREQFEKILTRAVETGLLNRRSISRTRTRYEHGLSSISYSSEYEATEWNLLKLELEKVKNNLVNMLLKGQTDEFCNLLISQSSRVTQNLLQINQMIENKTGRFEYLVRFNLVQLACAVGAHGPLILLLEYGGIVAMMIGLYVYPIHIALYEGHTDLIEPLLLYGGPEQIEYSSLLGTTLELAEKVADKDPLIYQKLFIT